MKSLKIMLLGLFVILLGMIIATNNFYAWVAGGLGIIIALIGMFRNDR